MTGFEKFILVLFYLSFFVGLFGLMIYWLIRDSNETYDPLYEPRSFQTTGKTYFLSGDCIMAYFLGGMALLFIHMAITVKVTDSTPRWQVVVALGLLALMMGALAFHILNFNINYWKHTRGTTLSFNPNPRTVTVSTPAGQYTIREGDIEHIEVVSNEHTKLLYSYFRIRLHNGDELLLTDKMPGIDAFFLYFKDIPHTRYKQDFPLIPEHA
ncbi:hypothetical protein [Telluribacter sp. SYSU D00476]|uniref:hypothetical protein n=1 Tax=Telluribacter sp. SYSU D00476 TaxID=2811430 RepID=UPI001FF5C91F|nr:hypothetical protein [Telluribacter sp. SYSU D00476]